MLSDARVNARSYGDAAHKSANEWYEQLLASTTATTGSRASPRNARRNSSTVEVSRSLERHPRCRKKSFENAAEPAVGLGTDYSIPGTILR